MLRLTPGDEHRQAARPPAGVVAARLAAAIESAEASFFAPVFMPFMLRASRRLADRLHSLGDLLYDAEPIHVQLLGPLVALAQTMPARTLTLELNIARLEDTLPGADPAARFAAFTRRLSSPDVQREMLGRYPVLARQFAIASRQWFRTTSQLLSRLAGDRAVLASRFGVAGPVTGIRLGLGDRHRGGATVTEVIWEADQRLIYKPRPMSLDVHFGQLLDWLNARGLSTPLRSPDVLDRDEYGWSGFVEAKPCDGPDGIHRFYHRQGCLLALLFVLRANDLHSENLIAAGEHPVLIDLESLIQPGLPLHDPSQAPAELLADEAVDDSVLATGLLPKPVWDAGSASATDTSGLGPNASQSTPIAMPYLTDRGSDRMRVTLERKRVEQTDHRPVDAGTTLSLLEYADDVVAGFAETYRLCASHREELSLGPLRAFADDEVRVIPRATMVYSAIMQTGFHPSLLGDRAARDTHFDALWREPPRLPLVDHVIEAERRDLWRNDIPLFTVIAGGNVLRDSAGDPVAGVPVEPGLDRVRRRLASLREPELARQTWLIRSAISTSALDTIEQATMGRYRHVPVAGSDTSELLAAADRIGHYLARISYQDGDTAQWLGVNANQGMHWSLGPLWSDLFHGLAGIALFLGCLGELTGDPEHTRLARRALATARVQISRDQIPGDQGMTGLPGVLYASGWLAHLWQSDEPLRDAGSWLARITARISADTEYDLVAGSAGTIACLLAVRRLAWSDELTGAIAAAGEHLRASAQPFPTGVGWLSPTVAALGRTELPLASLSHGVGGIAWSLFEAAELLGDAELDTTARLAIDYEQALFDPSTGSWRELRDVASAGLPEDLPPAAFWCYGATGIGLGRVMCRDHLAGNRLVDQEIAAAIAATRDFGFGNTHSLCHGDLGNLELLVRTGQPRSEILARAAAVVDNIRTSGWLCGTPQSVETPGLMTGVAGIGYGLLRAADPNRVPSVLTLD